MAGREVRPVGREAGREGWEERPEERRLEGLFVENYSNQSE